MPCNARRLNLLIFLVFIALCRDSFAQELKLANINLAPPPLPPSLLRIPDKTSPHLHRFWDAENRILFACVAASGAFDFAVTRANLQSGGQELNPIARIMGASTPGLAFNFTAETAGVIGVSYLLHKSGHHRLERITAIANSNASAAAASYGLIHR
jgi:hypothetical protein